VVKVFDDIFFVLGLQVDVSPLSKDDKILYLDWNNARKEKDFKKADQYRQKLIEKGILS
jgi:cysteinyl-tRNA synthetase